MKLFHSRSHLQAILQNIHKIQCFHTMHLNRIRAFRRVKTKIIKKIAQKKTNYQKAVHMSMGFQEKILNRHHNRKILNRLYNRRILNRLYNKRKKRQRNLNLRMYMQFLLSLQRIMKIQKIGSARVQVSKVRKILVQTRILWCVAIKIALII